MTFVISSRIFVAQMKIYKATISSRITLRITAAVKSVLFTTREVFPGHGRYVEWINYLEGKGRTKNRIYKAKNYLKSISNPNNI